MENQKNENSQHQDKQNNNLDTNSSDLEDKLYKELEQKLNKIEDNFEQNVKSELDKLVEDDSVEKTTIYSDTQKIQNTENVDLVNSNVTSNKIPLSRIEPEPTFKNSYTEKLDVASKSREKALKEGSNKYIKYSSIGAEMIGSVILGGFGGNWLDKKLELSFPFFTITLILLGLGATFTHLIHQLNADRKEEEEKAKNS